MKKLHLQVKTKATAFTQAAHDADTRHAATIVRTHTFAAPCV